MTYGESAGSIRRELAMLLRQHRIQQRVGGPGSHTIPVTTTAEERAEIGWLIQRYRMSILKWCEQAVTAASPKLELSSDSRRRLATPDVQLLRYLGRTIDGSTASTASTNELTTKHNFPLVESWRFAAKAATLGEHDFAGDLARGNLDVNQSLTIVKDAAEVVRALVVLDRRYANIPSWEPLRGSQMLERVARTCAFISAEDYSVDRKGWRPPARTLDGPARPGIAGVIQAEHNLLVHLRSFPNALNFKRVADSQRLISTLAANRFHTEAPELARSWAQRGRTYAKIQDRARNVGGLVGSGGNAAAQAANAVTRLRNLPDEAHVSKRALRDLNSLFTAVDQQMSSIFERGVNERFYFARTSVPRIVENDGQVIHRVRERFMPITAVTQTELVQLIREDLRPPPSQPGPPETAHASRAELRHAITHHSGRPGLRAARPAHPPVPEPPVTL